MAGCIWLIGGTQESVALARGIADQSLATIVTVTTASARSLYCGITPLSVEVGCLSEATIAAFLHQHGIDRILDASHPFATAISALAIQAAQQFQIPYLRYERLALAPVDGEMEPLGLDNFATLVSGNWLLGHRVLVIVGYRSLFYFQPWHERATLFARILPSTLALEAAFQAGFTPDRVIALRPPVPLELERSLWQHWKISMVVTKASGRAGGEDVKRQLAAELGIPLLVIERPLVAYPQQTSDVQVALAFCRNPRSTPPPG